MFGLGMPELLVILFIILLLFGAKRLPDMARSLGKALRELKNPGEDDKKDTVVQEDLEKEKDTEKQGD